MESVLAVSSILLWLVTIVNLLLVLVVVKRVSGKASAQDAKEEGLAIGQQAPSFSAETVGGERVTLADYTGRGQGAAFIFVGTACPPCRKALPDYLDVWPRALEAGIQLVLVSIDDSARTKSFVEELSLSLPVLVAPRETNPFMVDYQIPGTPSFCLVDSQGKVAGSGYPSVTSAAWAEFVSSLAPMPSNSEKGGQFPQLINA